MRFASGGPKTFGATLPNFQRIDETTLADHARLNAGDEVYYLYEYTSGRTYSFSATNSLISNLKKKPSKAHQPGYGYKAIAIQDCAAALRPAINPPWLNGATLVPVPPSKTMGDPDYDDRITRICNLIAAQSGANVRERGGVSLERRCSDEDKEASSEETQRANASAFAGEIESGARR